MAQASIVLWPAQLSGSARQDPQRDKTQSLNALGSPLQALLDLVAHLSVNRLPFQVNGAAPSVPHLLTLWAEPSWLCSFPFVLYLCRLFVQQCFCFFSTLPKFICNLEAQVKCIIFIWAPPDAITQGMMERGEQ